MWGIIGRLVVGATVVLSAGTMAAQPADADDAGGYTSWRIHADFDNPAAAPGDVSYGTPEYAIRAFHMNAGSFQIAVAQGDFYRGIELGGASGSPLVVGETYTGTREHPFNSADGPELRFLQSPWPGCGAAVGSFTVHEARYDGEVLKGFSATFEHRCLSHSGWVTGSIAWNATEPARSLPIAPDPEVRSIAPIENLTVGVEVLNLTFRWEDPADPDVREAIRCETPGTVPLSAPRDYCLQNSHERGGSTMSGQRPNETMTWTFWSRDPFGNLGPPRSVTMRGTVMTMSTVPASGEANTGIRMAGRVADGLSGQPVAGDIVEILVGHNSTATTYSNWNVVARLRTDDQGNFARTFPLRPGLSYFAQYNGGGTRMGNLSKRVPADGSSYIALDSDDEMALRGGVVRLVAHSGSTHRGDRVVFQRLRKGHWRNVAIRNASSGRTVLRTVVPTRTAAVYRAVLRSPGRASQPSVPVRVRHK